MEATTRANTPSPSGNGAAGAPISKVAASVHGAVDRMAGAADDAARKVAPAIGRVAEIAHQAVDKVADVSGSGANWLTAKGERIKETQRKAAADAGKYVVAHPWKSLGFALAAGFVISRFIR